MTTAYQLSEVEHVYGERCVVDIPVLDVNAGEILGIIGPSGAGKSTLLRLLNFVETPTRGHVHYRGEPTDSDLALTTLREVTTVFQRPLLLRRSVAANVRIGLSIRGVAPRDHGVDWWLDRLGLAHLAGSQVRTLSAGEAQRVAIARALVVNPAVLLLDEPTGNLDPYNVGLIEGIIREESAERGTTIVIVTHDSFQARRLADRTGLMITGQIIELSETERFFEDPTHARTAAFLRGDLVY